MNELQKIRREAIFKLQDCLQADFVPLDPEIKHHFAKGVYAREMFLPKGGLVVGKIHRYDHFSIIKQGEAMVADEDGSWIAKAPDFFKSKAGVKRVIGAIEDLVWITIHVTNETDLTRIEQEVIAETYEIL